FPVDSGVAETVSRAVSVFEEVGAHVEEVRLGITRSQKELSEVWSRLYMLFNMQAIENMKRDGIDLLGQHREDFPPEYLHWVETSSRLSALDFYRDQAVRAEIYNAVQRVLSSFDLLITPTLACPPVDNADDGNTVGPNTINGVAVDPLIGWC